MLALDLRFVNIVNTESSIEKCGYLKTNQNYQNAKNKHGTE